MTLKRNLVLIGNPNSGKSTFFNGLTGSRQKIGNWPGVTVDKIEGEMTVKGSRFNVVDLPGIYSLSASSEDEKVSRDYLLSCGADLVVNIIDAANIERNLYLTTQLLEMDLPLVVVLNRIDIAEKQGKKIDAEELSRRLGTRVLVLSAVSKNSVNNVREEITGLLDENLPKKNIVEYPNEIESIIEKMKATVGDYSMDNNINPRWLALKVLEKDKFYVEELIDKGILTKDLTERIDSKISSIFNESSDVIIADYRYGFIYSIIKNVLKKPVNKREISDFIDRIVLNRFLGIPIFLGLMYTVFWFTLSFGGAFIGFFEDLSGLIFIEGTAGLLQTVGSPEWLIALVSTGVGSGIQAVATFIPIIFMMFLLLSVLEDSGYMARAAYVMDKLMRIIGLPGKAFLPLVIGFGCTVPAIMAARTLDEKKDRMITIFITPFMSCGARLSVYLLFVAAFFRKNPGTAIFSLYLVGAILAVLTGLLIKKTIYSGEVSFFVMELPTYNLPRIRHILIHTWSRLKQFIYSAGKIIIIAVFFLSVLNSVGTDGSWGNENGGKSVLTKIGKAISPVLKPLGIEEKNWAASVAILSGPFAKEAVVGTLSTIYHSQAGIHEEETKEEWGTRLIGVFKSLPDSLSLAVSSFFDPLGIKNSSREVDESDKKYGVLSSLRQNFKNVHSAYAYLLFLMIYFPCLATVGAVVREAGSKVALAQILYMTVLAWIVSVLYYQSGYGHSLFWIIVSLGLLVLLVSAFFLAGYILRKKGKIG